MSLRRIQLSLTENATTAARRKSVVTSVEARRRKDSIDQKLQEEERERVAALSNDIALLMVPLPSWSDGPDGGLPIDKLVGALRTFSRFLTQQGRVEATLELFPDLPSEDEVEVAKNEPTTAVLSGTPLIEKLHAWTATLRKLPDTTVMELLVEHLTSCFAGNVTHSVIHKHIKRIVGLFHDIDFSHSKKISRDTIKLAVSELKPILQPEASSSDENEAAEADAEAPETTAEPAESTNEVAPSKEATPMSLVDASAPGTGELDLVLKRRRVIDERRGTRLRSVRAIESQGRWNHLMSLAEFEELLLGLAGCEPDESTWNKICTVFIDTFTGARAAQLKQFVVDKELAAVAERTDQIFRRIDADESGFLEPDEVGRFFSAWKEMPLEQAETEATALFEKMGPQDETGKLRLDRIAFRKMIHDDVLQGLPRDVMLKRLDAMEKLLKANMVEMEKFERRSAHLSSIKSALNGAVLQPSGFYRAALNAITSEAAAMGMSNVRAYITEAQVVEVDAECHVTALKCAAVTQHATVKVGTEIGLIGREAVDGSTEATHCHSRHSTRVVDTGLFHHDDSDGTVVVPITDPTNLRVPHGMVGTLAFEVVPKNEEAEAVPVDSSFVAFLHGVAAALQTELKLLSVRRGCLKIARESIPWLNVLAEHDVNWYLSIPVSEDEVDIFRDTSVSFTQLSCEQVTRTSENKNLFWSAIEGETTSTKLEDSCHTYFPIRDDDSNVFLVAEVISHSRLKLTAQVERDIVNVLKDLRPANAVLHEGDVAPPESVVSETFSNWHLTMLVCDAFAPMLSFVRFRLLGLRSAISAQPAFVLANVQQSSKVDAALNVGRCVMTAFLGKSQWAEASWEDVRAMMTADLQRSIQTYDPSREVYVDSLAWAANQLCDLTRRDLLEGSVQPFVVMLYDWLKVCIAISKLRSQPTAEESGDGDGGEVHASAVQEAEAITEPPALTTGAEPDTPEADAAAETTEAPADAEAESATPSGPVDEAEQNGDEAGETTSATVESEAKAEASAAVDAPEESEETQEEASASVEAEGQVEDVVAANEPTSDVPAETVPAPEPSDTDAPEPEPVNTSEDQVPSA